MLEVELLRQLDGKEAGDKATYPERDAERLRDRGIVKILGPAKEAAAPENKMEPQPENKAADVSVTKAPARKRGEA